MSIFRRLITFILSLFAPRPTPEPTPEPDLRFVTYDDNVVLYREEPVTCQNLTT